MARDHEPIIINKFNGLWQRGQDEVVPPDHFSDCNNIKYLEGGFATRDGLDTYRGIDKVVRIYNYTTQTGPTLLILTSEGKIFHSISPSVTYGPVLTIPTMTDFGFVAFAGRAYITPHNGVKGITGEFLYVYKGDGTNARKAGGVAPTATPTATSSATGFCEAGVHIVAVSYETDTGFITKAGPRVSVTCADNTKITVSLPIGPTGTVARRVLVSKAIDATAYTGDKDGYQLFFATRVANNTATTVDISFFDASLLEDAWYLLDILEEIPAGAGLNTFHNRLVTWASYADISLIRLSAPGEPEAFDSITGLIIFPLDGNPITFVQEFRDVMYAYKETKTNSWIDNGDDPTSWPMTIVDNGIGCFVHGMATVLDSSGVNVEFLMIANLSGIVLFNGIYAHPELTYKIEDLWKTMTEAQRRNVQLLNDSIDKLIYVNLPNRRLLVGDYKVELDPKSIKWTKWSFNINMTTIALTEKNKLIMGATPDV